MTTLTLAIDPGLTGAFALLAPTGDVIAVEDLPVVRDGTLAWIDGDRLMSRLLELRNGVAVTAIVERVHAMPKNGSQAAFSQGCTLGSIVATLQIAHVRIEFVAPSVWKRDLGLTFGKQTKDGARKRASLDKARLLYPGAPLDRQKDHGRAEALLLAHWHQQRRERVDSTIKVFDTERATA